MNELIPIRIFGRENGAWLVLHFTQMFTYATKTPDEAHAFYILALVDLAELRSCIDSRTTLISNNLYHEGCLDHGFVYNCFIEATEAHKKWCLTR